MSSLELFHLLRPWMLLLLIPGWLFVWWLLRQQNDILRWKAIVNPKLLSHLLLESGEKVSKIQAPWHLGIVWTVIILALSGPAWQLKPAPFTEDEAQIVFVMKVTESMETKDLTPSRLKRAVFKMKDLMDLRPDTKAALVAYSGSAHLVLPLTKDHAILNTFSQALSPGIMPQKGDNLKDALLLASEQFDNEGGTIVVFADAVDPAQANALSKKGLTQDAKVLFLAVASPELLDAKGFEQSVSLLGAEWTGMTVDDQDVKKIASWVDTAFQQAGAKDDTRYEDGGYMLIPLILLLMLLWFRQGFIAEAWRVS
ncbi:vWA domain-containing protein [Sulfurovum sp. CS9]|uniref:VWA domain-containing protein n=1 Tax=Sulfurovum sp. CS9 TaxID=3391146 RepID=UPI0039E96AC8